MDRWSMFLPYLWGMETTLKISCSCGLTQSSYRTYEEWKLAALASFLMASSVLTVPMRNGNYSGSWISHRPARFLPYLWGMETWECGWCHAPIFKVLTVPMRNGNNKVEQEDVLGYQFLPYLWGMETRLVMLRQLRVLRSYRTYEEWKHYPVDQKSRPEGCVLTVPMRNGNMGVWVVPCSHF